MDSNRTPEQNARTDIDALLSAAGWVVQDYRASTPPPAVASPQVGELGFGRLPQYFSAELLAAAKVVAVAYDAQARFDSDPIPFDAELLVSQFLRS